MLSPTTIGRYKNALILDAEHGGYLVPGTRLYRQVGHVKVYLPLLGKQARATLRKFQERRHLKVTGELDAATREALIPTTPGERAVDIMVTWCKAGWTEVPAYSNRVPQLASVARSQGLSAWYQQMGWPWCMFAAFLALRIAGAKAAVDGFKGDWNVLYTVALYDMSAKGEHGTRRVSKSEAKKGTVVLFDFPGGQVVDHVGILRLKPVLGFVFCATAEGNTSAGAAGSQSNGGRLALRIRRASSIRAYIEVT